MSLFICDFIYLNPLFVLGRWSKRLYVLSLRKKTILVTLIFGGCLYSIYISSVLCYFLPSSNFGHVCVCVCVHTCSVMSDSAAPWTEAHQAPLSLEFSKQAYWSVMPFPPPGNLPDPEMEPHCLCLQHEKAGSLPLVPPQSVQFSSVVQLCLTL